jgi:hypothetical protein
LSVAVVLSSVLSNSVGQALFARLRSSSVGSARLAMPPPAMSRRPLAWRPEQIEFPRPNEECFDGLLLLGPVPRTLKPVEHFVAVVEAWPCLMLANEHQRVC